MGKICVVLMCFYWQKKWNDLCEWLNRVRSLDELATQFNFRPFTRQYVSIPLGFPFVLSLSILHSRISEILIVGSYFNLCVDLAAGWWDEYVFLSAFLFLSLQPYLPYLMMPFSFGLRESILRNLWIFIYHCKHHVRLIW